MLKLFNKMPIWLLFLLVKANFFVEYFYGYKYWRNKKKFFRFDEGEFVSFVNKVMATSSIYKNVGHVRNIYEFKHEVPFVNKDVVLENFDLFVASDTYFSDLITTGGTSGKPLKLLVPKNRFQYEWAALAALWSTIGFNKSFRAVVRNDRLNGMQMKINPITREFIFDGFDSSDQHQRFIYDQMKKYGVSFFHGYTSNAERFFSFLEREKLDPSFIKGVITSSENLYEHQIRLFNRFPNIQHMNFYGHSEKLLLGGWCEPGDCYHFYDSYGFAELVDENGGDITDVGDVGELVGSTCYNEVMPLLRYRTGDYAIKAPSVCKGCGFKGLSVSRILGRWSGERVFNTSGSFVTTTALNLHSLHYGAIDALQYYQARKGQLEVRVVANENFNSEIGQDLIKLIKEKFDPDFHVELKLVDEVEKHENGKYLLLLSDVKESK